MKAHVFQPLLLTASCLVMASTGCSASSGGGTVAPVPLDSGAAYSSSSQSDVDSSSGASDAGDAMPGCSVTTCTLTDGSYDCDCDGGVISACPAGTMQALPCTAPPLTSCSDCSEGAGNTCVCVESSDAGGGDGGGIWSCVGSGFACK